MRLLWMIFDFDCSASNEVEGKPDAECLDTIDYLYGCFFVSEL